VYNINMKKNIGTADRIIRLILALILFIVAIFMPLMVFKVVFILIGLFCIYEALFSWCLFYKLIGRNTCPLE
jgi:hypothetical protein